MSMPLPAPVSGGPAVLSRSRWVAEFRAQFKLGWPLIVAQLAQISLLTTDVVMLGWLGPKYLAASALANALFIAMQLFGIGVVEAVSPLVAQALGSRNSDAIGPIMRQGILAGFVVGVLLFPIIWNIGSIYALLGQDPELTAMAERFVHFAIWLIFPAFQIIVLRSFLAAHGNTGVILVITIAGFFVNIACDYALIFGNWGFPKLDLAGAGIATTVVNLVMLALTVLYIETHKHFRVYRMFHRLLHIDWPRMRDLLRVGVPIGIMRLAEVLLFTSAALLQGWLGQDEVAAHAIALQLASIAFMVPLGISQATTVRVGLAFGQHDPEGIRIAGWTSLAATLLFMAATAVAFLAVPHALVGLFLDPGNPANTHAISLAVSYIVVAGFFQLFDGTQVTMAAALRGLSDTRAPLIIALVGYWLVGFPVSWLFGFPLGLRGVGIWLGLAAGLAAVGLVLGIRFAWRDRLGLTARTPD
ncbi:MAG: MATE family efflux transporter [Devosia sp.]